MKLSALLILPLAAAAAVSLAAEPAGSAPQLSGRDMMWAAAAGEDCEVPPEIAFGKDGRVSGNAGCNDLSGEWKLDGKKISLAGVRAEGRKCGPKISAVEEKFMKALHAAAYAAADGDKVRLYDAAGKELIVLVPAAAGACL